MAFLLSLDDAEDVTLGVCRDTVCFLQMTSSKTHFYVEYVVPMRSSYIHESASKTSFKQLCHQMDGG